jgi:hypothetical protein
MRLTALTLLLLLFCCSTNAQETNTPATPSELYDLRGPGLQVGDTITFEFRASTNSKSFKSSQFGTIDSVHLAKLSTREETRVLAMDGRDVTKFERKLVSSETSNRASFGGISESAPGSEDSDKLLNIAIIGQRKEDGHWTFSRSDPGYSELSEDDLKCPIPGSYDFMFPECKVEIGHTWVIDAADYQRAFQIETSEVGTFEGNAKLSKIEVFKGEQCAVIEYTIKTDSPTETIKQGDSEAEVDQSMEGKCKVWKSLQSGMCLRIRFDGTMQMKVLNLETLDESEYEYELKAISTFTKKTADDIAK